MFTSKLKYEYPGRYYLILSYVGKRSTPKVQSSPRVLSIDPGVRTFASIFNHKGEYNDYGTNDISRLIKIALRTDKLWSELETGTKLNDAISNQTFIDTNHFNQKDQTTYLHTAAMKKVVFRQNYRRNLRKKIAGNVSRVRNLRKDMHWKLSSQLSQDYDHILIPSFQTSEMVLRAKRKINNKTVRSMLNWGHYEFREKLKHKAFMNGTSVHVVTEAWSSKTCGNCGRIKHNLGGSDVYKCIHTDCKLTRPRDWNAARTIFLMNVESSVGQILNY